MIIFMITILSTNNIIANSNRLIIVTIVNSSLIIDLVTNFQFAFRKSVSYVINLIVDRQIILKKNATTSKSVLRIVISNKNRVKNLNILWNNLSLNSKIIKMRISSFNSSKNWTSTSRSRLIIFRLMNSSLNSTTRQNHFSSSSIRSMIWRQFLQSSSCSLTKHLNTDSYQWISSLLHWTRYRTFIMFSLRQDTWSRIQRHINRSRRRRFFFKRYWTIHDFAANQ